MTQCDAAHSFELLRTETKFKIQNSSQGVSILNINRPLHQSTMIETVIRSNEMLFASLGPKIMKIQGEKNVLALSGCPKLGVAILAN